MIAVDSIFNIEFSDMHVYIYSGFLSEEPWTNELLQIC